MGWNPFKSLNPFSGSGGGGFSPISNPFNFSGGPFRGDNPLSMLGNVLAKPVVAPFTLTEDLFGNPPFFPGGASGVRSLFGSDPGSAENRLFAGAQGAPGGPGGPPTIQGPQVRREFGAERGAAQGALGGPVPTFLGVQGGQPGQQQRSRLATLGTQGGAYGNIARPFEGPFAGQGVADVAQAYYRNLLTMALTDEGGGALGDASLLPIERQYLQQTYGTPLEESPAGWLSLAYPDGAAQPAAQPAAPTTGGFRNLFEEAAQRQAAAPTTGGFGNLF